MHAAKGWMDDEEENFGSEGFWGKPDRQTDRQKANKSCNGIFFGIA